MDGITVAENVHQLRLKPGDSEKITINLGYVDLGHIDLMVQEGFYSNRTDFIRTAIRNQLERHADVVKQSTARKHLDLGLRHYSREDLETARSAGEMLHIRVLGLASIAPGCHPRTCSRHSRLGRCAGSVARQSGGQGRSSRQDAVTSDPELNPDEMPNGAQIVRSLADASIVSEQKEAFDMNDMLNPNSMLEATRLTRAGRLAEATTLDSAHASR